jgi:hypothetical protein
MLQSWKAKALADYLVSSVFVLHAISPVPKVLLLVKKT